MWEALLPAKLTAEKCIFIVCKEIKPKTSSVSFQFEVFYGLTKKKNNQIHVRIKPIFNVMEQKLERKFCLCVYFVSKMISVDMENWEPSHTWAFSCYTYVKDGSCLPGKASPVHNSVYHAYLVEIISSETSPVVGLI